MLNLVGMSYPDLVAAAVKVPQGVVCLISVLAFHELTTQFPHEVPLADGVVRRDEFAPRVERAKNAS